MNGCLLLYLLYVLHLRQNKSEFIGDFAENPYRPENSIEPGEKYQWLDDTRVSQKDTEKSSQPDH